jgi:hypothetical protein
MRKPIEPDRGALDDRRLLERLESRPRRPVERAEPVRHEDAVLLAQRHDVRHRPERDQVEVAAEVGQRRVPARTELHAQAHQQVEHDARARQALERELAVRAQRVQHRQRRRARGGRVVMVAHDHVEPEGARERELRDVRRPAVGRHEDARPRVGQGADRAGVEAVALAEAVRHVQQRVGPQLAQKEHELRRARDAVDVVVAVHGDALAARDRVGEAARRDVHVLQ